MANPKRSDHNVASRAGVSQPTVSRTRNRLEEKGVIQSYQVMPNLEKLGFEIIAFSTVDPEAFVEKDMRVVFAVQGMFAVHGIRNMFVMSVHKNYTDYANFACKYKAERVLLTITSVAPVKPLSFKDVPF